MIDYDQSYSNTLHEAVMTNEDFEPETTPEKDEETQLAVQSFERT